MRLAIEVSARRFTGGPAKGRRSFYARLGLGRRSWWVQRWALHEPRKPYVGARGTGSRTVRVLWTGPVFMWTAGTWRVGA